MAHQDDSHNSPGTSSGKGEKTPIVPTGLKMEDLYALESACAILSIGDTRMKELRRAYVNDGITRIGNDFFCFGKDLAKILMIESTKNA